MSSGSKKSKAGTIPNTKTSTLLGSVEKFLAKNSDKIFYAILGIGIVFSLMMFNARIVENDDALYIEGGYHYATNFFGYYYTVNAPLYIMFLALPIAIFGINLIALKLFSVLFFALSVLFFYRAYKNKIPNTILFVVLLAFAWNSYIVAYASYTFTEAFYMMLQSFFMIALFNHIQKPAVETQNVAESWRAWLWIGFLLFILSLTRNVAAAAVGAVMLYFLFQKQFRNALYTAMSFSIFFGLYSAVKKILWGDIASSQFSMQSGLLFQKDAYDASKGMETFGGFITRFIENTQIYFSARFFEILGFRSENSDPSIFLTLVFFAFIGIGLFYIVKNKEKFLLLSALYFLTLCGATFISLHTSWGQPRFVMIHLPFILITGLYGLHRLAVTPSFDFGKPIFFITMVLIIGVGIYETAQKSSENLPVLQKNLNGDIYAGYPDQWASYVRMSRWCADHLDTTSTVACRKAPVSFVYGSGKSFTGIYAVSSNDPDTLLNRLHRSEATHIILDAIAGTVYRYMSIVESKYKGTFEMIHQEGSGETAAYLFKIHYR